LLAAAVGSAASIFRALEALAVLADVAGLKVQLARRERQWVEQVGYESHRYRLVGSSPAMQRAVGLLQKVAPTDSTVLVRGASGTGKELVARALQYNSPHRDQPLVTVKAAYELKVKTERQRAGIEAARAENGGRCPWGGTAEAHFAFRVLSVLAWDNSFAENKLRFSSGNLLGRKICNILPLLKSLLAMRNNLQDTSATGPVRVGSEATSNGIR
jgi:hypothetical protein